jgi:hypothetical protein
MTTDQKKHALAAVSACARLLGPDIAPDKPAPEQYARALAFMLGQLMRKAPLVEAVARWSLEYLPAPDLDAAPTGKGDA